MTCANASCFLCATAFSLVLARSVSLGSTHDTFINGPMSNAGFAGSAKFTKFCGSRPKTTAGGNGAEANRTSKFWRWLASRNTADAWTLLVKIASAMQTAARTVRMVTFFFCYIQSLPRGVCLGTAQCKHDDNIDTTIKYLVQTRQNKLEDNFTHKSHGNQDNDPDDS